MLATLIAAALSVVMPPCATEDSYMCLWQNNDQLIVNLAPADPGPESFTLTVNG